MKKIVIGMLVLVAAVVVAVLAGRIYLAERPPNEPATGQILAEPASAVPDPVPAPSPADAGTDAAKLALENELAAARRELTELRMKAASDAAEPPKAAKAEKPASFMDAFASMMDSPDMQEAMKTQQRMALEQTYGELIRGLNLDDEQADRFKDLLTERNMSHMTVGFKQMKGQAGAIDTDKLMKSMERFDAEFKELLGEDGHEMFKQYEETQMERMQVDMLKERLRGDLALDWDTQDRLIRAMAEARKALPADEAMKSMSENPGMPDPKMMDEVARRMDDIQASYLQSAADILNQEQLAAFEASLNQFSAMQKAGLEMAKSMFGDKKDGEE